MTPALISQLMLIPAVASWVKSQWGVKTPELEPDYWKEWYNPSRIHQQYAPIKSAMQGREEMQFASSAEEAGGRGVLGGQAHRVQKRAISDDTSRILTEVLGRISSEEMGRARDEGMTKFKADWNKAMADRSGYSQLATSLATPFLYKTIKGLGFGEKADTDKLGGLDTDKTGEIRDTRSWLNRLLEPVPKTGFPAMPQPLPALTPPPVDRWRIGDPLPETTLPQTTPFQAPLTPEPEPTSSMLDALLMAQMMPKFQAPMSFPYGQGLGYQPYLPYRRF